MRNIVCLCGSTRFSAEYQEANLRETLAGQIVLTIGCDMRSDAEIFADKTEAELEEIKSNLDELHLRKINMAFEILVLNVGGYVGKSTSREIEYAQNHHTSVRWLEPQWVRATEPIGWHGFTMPVGTVAILHPESNMAYYPDYPDRTWRSAPTKYDYIETSKIGVIDAYSINLWLEAVRSDWIKQRYQMADIQE